MFHSILYPSRLLLVIYCSMPNIFSHCWVSLSVSPRRFSTGSFGAFFRLNRFWTLSQKSSDFIAVAFLTWAALRNLRSLLTMVNPFGAVLALILSSMTVSASVPCPAKKTSRLLMLSNPLLSRGPVPSKIISPVPPINFKYLPTIQHN